MALELVNSLVEACLYETNLGKALGTQITSANW